MSRLLQISDCHLVSAPEMGLLGVDTDASLQLVLQRALAQYTPDLIVASGDIAHDATAHNYERFVALIRAQTDAPLMMLPGNHDEAEVMAPWLAQFGSPRALGDWRIQPLSSWQAGSSAGALDATEVADAIDACRNARHVLLTVHHPFTPFAPCGTPWLDTDAIELDEQSALLAWLNETDCNVRAIAVGHVHQAWESWHNATPMRSAPSTCFQFAPASESFAVTDAGPGYRWWQLGDDGVASSTAHWC
ncbi:MAG: metallophosphoesterase [Pseudomonadaceae bacterium]|nr:metallophosphoesterase [Pseudomonadaceae bacterium]